MTDLLVPSPDLQPGDIYLTRSEGTVGALIRFGERVEFYGWWGALKLLARSVWNRLHGRDIPEDPSSPSWGNHIAVYEGLIGGQPMLSECLAKGLVLSPLDKYPPGTFRVLKLVCTDDERRAGEEFAKKELAKRHKYGWLSAFSKAMQLLTPSRLDLTIDGTMMCSCWGARRWEHCGKTIPVLSTYTCLPSALAVFAGALPPAAAL